jgi:hypothetical protein
MTPVAWLSYSLEFHEVWPINLHTIHAFTTEIRSRRTDGRTDRQDRQTDRQTNIRRPSVRLRSNSEERKQSEKGVCSISYFSDLWNQLNTMIVFFSVLVSWGEVRLSPLGTSATGWPIVPATDDRLCVWSGRWNGNWQGKPKYSEKTCHGATLFTTNSTWPDLGSNPGRRGRKSATNRLN